MMLPELEWKKMLDSVARDLVVELVGAEDSEMLEPFEFHGDFSALTFYKQLKLVRLQSTFKVDGTRLSDLYALWKEEASPLLLDGLSAPIHEVNQSGEIQLTTDTAADYIRFFCFAVRGAEGPFILLEQPPAEDVPGREAVAKHAKPLNSKGQDEKGRYLFEAVVAYNGDAFSAVFAVAPDGNMEMIDDNPLSEKLPANALPTVPNLESGSMLRTYLSAVRAGITSPEKAAPADKPTFLVLVELLLEQALRYQRHNRLIEHFNASLASASPLDQFAALMVTASPVVVVESSLPFVEEMIGRISIERRKPEGRFQICTADVGADEGQISFSLPGIGRAMILVPLQVYKRVANLERLAYDIASRDFSAIIACEAFEQLPESLRLLKDVTLKLPPIDGAIFETLFERVMGEPLPLGWQATGDVWVKHVMHTDFEHPRRMKLPRDKAFEYVRTQVTERLAVIDPVQGMGLKELYGLGEARQFAEDLIADIHAALKGRIPWSQVDRGALLAGPPGTGKTTLAKAIAKDCNVKFIRASATEWATGGYLGQHIAAIRRTFSEARRYAPSILFIDEIDSLGNREQFAGNNAMYETEIVNAVLEQLQGVDPAAPVFILGATNHEDRVDPALRRSGRLDRVIRIPRPNSESLAQIYTHYLAVVAANMALEPSIDTKALGGLSLGLTGADVERIVRGAARRARKEGRPVSQTDIIAEITNKPRNADSTLRLTPAEIERIAFHEAGHALASYLSASGGADIGFVTIVPRDDGTLGFVASAPDERVSLTRRDYEEKIEIFLAGRAAEEITYGEALVSGGAASDLQAATSLAAGMVTRLGLGTERRLLWSERPTAEDLGQAEKLLAGAYDRIMRKLRENETLLTALANELMTRQELTGDEVRGVLAK